MLKKLAAGFVGAAALVAFASPAAAHVTVSPGEASADGFATVTFTVGHGCEDSPTTSVSVTIPDGIDATTPGVNPGWAIERETAPLDDADASGEPDEATERVATVTWTAEPGNALPSDELTFFAMSVRMPDDAGETLYFPVVQTCEEGTARWIEIPEGDDEPEFPAPGVVLTASTGGHGGGDASETEDENVDTSSLATSSDVDGIRTLAIVAIAVGAVGIVLGVIALLTRRSTA